MDPEARKQTMSANTCRSWLGPVASGRASPLRKSPRMRSILACVIGSLFAVLLGGVALAAPPPAQPVPGVRSTVGRWDRFEASVVNSKRYADPYHSVTLNVTYTRPDQQRRDEPAVVRLQGRRPYADSCLPCGRPLLRGQLVGRETHRLPRLGRQAGLQHALHRQPLPEPGQPWLGHAQALAARRRRVPPDGGHPR